MKKKPRKRLRLTSPSHRERERPKTKSPKSNASETRSRNSAVIVLSTVAKDDNCNVQARKWTETHNDGFIVHYSASQSKSDKLKTNGNSDVPKSNKQTESVDSLNDSTNTTAVDIAAQNSTGVLSGECGLQDVEVEDESNGRWCPVGDYDGNLANLVSVAKEVATRKRATNYENRRPVGDVRCTSAYATHKERSERQRASLPVHIVHCSVLPIIRLEESCWDGTRRRCQLLGSGQSGRR